MSASEPTQSSRRAKNIFGDCALVEIIHLHDCFRGALTNLEHDVNELCREISAASDVTELDSVGNSTSDCVDSKLIDLERRVAGRFTVIWTVFRAHSAAEDEFIWPALKAKQVSVEGTCGCDCASSLIATSTTQNDYSATNAPNEFQGGEVVEAVVAEDQENRGDHQPRERSLSMSMHRIEQEEYEEDHADEERMFNSIDVLLSNLRDELSKRRNASTAVAAKDEGTSELPPRNAEAPPLKKLAKMLLKGTRNLMRHLMNHLDKEETHCMPLVAQYLTKMEINDLVGKIMGKRSSELMSQILTMAVQNLPEADRDEMVRYMKQAMVGTFFERWLKMGGWMEKTAIKPEEIDNGGGKASGSDGGREGTGTVSHTATSTSATNVAAASKETLVSAVIADQTHSFSLQSNAPSIDNSASTTDDEAPENYTSGAELEKLIRAIGTNPHLDPKQKALTIQGLRDSVWKSNCRLSKRKREVGEDALALDQTHARAVTTGATAGGAVTVQVMPIVDTSQSHHMRQHFSASSGVATRFKRETPPSSYFKKTSDGGVKLVWSSNPNSTQFHPNDASVPLFSASELAPTYHDGGINHVLGCPHYARSCKLRHPASGRLYTCRLCCEQTREMASKDKDSQLDRYEVKEILCMRCGALQPAGDKCVNPECQSVGKPFARYHCGICNFYDDSSNKSIYHCPFCNVCRSGQGLGIDYRHCMRCNACVSLKDDHHHCIPQRLQGNCPICHDAMFESTEPLRGLKCGHVMHLNCYIMYMRGYHYTCPLCKRSAEDMSEYFALLDSAVRMQPMPIAYVGTSSNIYCQDCYKMGNVMYHFVGLKCLHCGSYNTRELQRVDATVDANIVGGMRQGN